MTLCDFSVIQSRVARAGTCEDLDAVGRALAPQLTGSSMALERLQWALEARRAQLRPRRPSPPPTGSAA